MKSNLLFSVPLLAMVLATSCSSDNVVDRIPDTPTEDNTLTFTIRTNSGGRVSYSRASDEGIQDSDEYCINSLVLYEYEVMDNESTSLTRVLKYPDGKGTNNLDLQDNHDGTYAFSIIVPADHDGKTYTYRFVANNATVNPALSTDFSEFAETKAALVLQEGDGGEVLARNGIDEESNDINSIAMTGVAVRHEEAGNGTEQKILMSKGVACDVALQRIVSRIDIRHQIPNLRIDEATLENAPVQGNLFPGAEIPYIFANQEGATFTMAMNKKKILPDTYLRDLEGAPEDKVVNISKAFYFYERQNEENNTLAVRIRYHVVVNSKDEQGNYIEHEGETLVPFMKTDGSGEYVNAERNHLYTIVLGNGTDPVAGYVRATLTVDDWNPVEIDEPLTD